MKYPARMIWSMVIAATTAFILVMNDVHMDSWKYWAILIPVIIVYNLIWREG